jgi:hypothetical protein
MLRIPLRKAKTTTTLQEEPAISFDQRDYFLRSRRIKSRSELLKADWVTDITDIIPVMVVVRGAGAERPGR